MLFGRKEPTLAPVRATVSQIVGDIELKCKQLIDLSQVLRGDAQQKKDKAAQLMAEHDAHHIEADHAERVAGKFQSLLD